jgi:hypothetical protein
LFAIAGPGARKAERNRGSVKRGRAGVCQAARHARSGVGEPIPRTRAIRTPSAPPSRNEVGVGARAANATRMPSERQIGAAALVRRPVLPAVVAQGDKRAVSARPAGRKLDDDGRLGTRSRRRTIRSSGFANTDLDLQLKKHGIHKLSVIGLIAHTCIEATVRYAAELGYDVTVVRDATADYSDEMMNAALDINMPNYAGTVASTEEIVAAIATM